MHTPKPRPASRRLLTLGLACLVLSAAALLFGRLGGAEARPPAPFPDVLHHHVALRLDLAGHRLIAKDTISFPAAAPTPLRVRLNPELKITSVHSMRASVAMRPGHAKAVAGEPGLFELAIVPGATEVELHYAGVIYDQVKKSDDLSWVVGDDTRGVIDANGVYLSGASGFIPRVPGQRVAAFDLTTIVPAPYLTVTQGSVPIRASTRAKPGFHTSDRIWPGAAPEEGTGAGAGAGDAFTVSVSHAVLPTDGVSLVAGRFVTKSRDVEGVRLTTYFFPQDAGAMDLWLDNGAATVKRYAPLLGDYPHPKFDIVSNFFQTGYGMPGWTLLGDRVIRYVTAKARRSDNQIPPGYLDHEYVHGWYGNGLFVDYPTGNWCEAITTYFSNYLAKELESKEAGKAHRQGVLEKYAIRISPANDYPLREFMQKTEDKDNDIGYGKGSMLFHMIRKQVGDRTFFDTVLAFTQSHVGQVVRWEDWFAAFSQASDQDIAAHDLPFLDRKGLPSLLLTDATSSKAPDGSWRLAIRIESKPGNGATWPLDVPVRITLADGSVVQHVEPLAGEPFAETYALPARPVDVALDPDYDLLRHIPDEDLPPCLNRTLEQAGGTVFLETDLRPFQGVAGRIARSKGFTLKQGAAEITGPAVVFALAKPGTSIEVGGKTWQGDDLAVLRTTVEAGHPVTRFTAFSESMAPRASYATYYGWDTWVVFKGHLPVARGTDRRQDTLTARTLAAAEAPAPAAGAAATLEKLCSKAFEGRRPGTAGHARTTAWLEARLKAELPQVSRHPFRVPVAERRSSRDLVVVLDGKREIWPKAFRPLCLDASQQRTVDIALDELGAFGSDEASPGAWVQHLRALHTLLPHDAWVFRATGDAAKTLPAWLDTPASLTEVAEALLARPGRNGKPRPRPPLASWIAGRRSRSLPAGATVEAAKSERLPAAIVLSGGIAERLAALSGRGARLQFEVDFEPVLPQGGTDLVGYLPAPGAPTPATEPGATRPAVVVLSAHYDALGQVGDAFYPGADDNGSGVTCLLEIIRGIQKDWAKRPGRTLGLLVCLTDCEEWGLWGSRHLAATLPTQYDIRAVINVDSVGRATTKPTYVLGITKHPKLAERVLAALATGGLKPPTRVIDKYAYAYGSDHWPFHEAGLPAVSLWATDYAVMNTADDTIDKVETDGIDRLARALRALLLAGD